MNVWTEWMDKSDLCDYAKLFHVMQHFKAVPSDRTHFAAFVMDACMSLENSLDDSCPEITFEMIRKVTTQYEELLHTVIQRLVEQNKPETDFYDDLWRVVFESPLFPEEDTATQTVLLSLLLEDNLIPYWHLPNAMPMEAELFKSIQKKIAPQLLKLGFILNRHYSMRSEEASAILDILDELPDRRDKLVFLSGYKAALDSRLAQLQQMLSQGDED